MTTSIVVAEGQGWFLRRHDTTRALQFLAMIETMEPLRVIGVGTPEIRGGTELLRRFPDRRLTLTDAVGLFVMKSLRAGSCWSTDRHMGLTGVPLAIGRESLGEPRGRSTKRVEAHRSR